MIPKLAPVALGILTLTIFFVLFKMLKGGIKDMGRRPSNRIIIMMILMLGTLGAVPTLGAVQAYGIDVPDISWDGLPVAIECTGLTAGTIYTVYAESTLKSNFTCHTGQTSRTVMVNLDRPTDGVLTITLRDQAGTTTHATVDVELPEFETFVPVETVISLAVIVILFFALLGFVNDIKSERM